MKGLPALLGGLGLVAVSFGLLSALIAIFQPVTDLAWIVGNLAIGVLLLSAALFVGFDSVRQRLRSGEAKRVGQYGSNALVSTLSSIAILGMLGYLSTSYSREFDWSEAGVNTLTEQSQSLLARLEAPTTITAFFPRTALPEVSALLDRYGRAERVRVVYVDPNSAPLLVEELGIDPEALARGLVRLDTAAGGITVTDLSESGITNGLLKLTRSSQKKVYFIDGHNERVIADQAGEAAQGKESMGRAADALRNETYTAESLPMATRGEIPEDADAVIIAGPTRPYFDHEIAALRDYVAAGGAALFLVDPRARTNLYGLLEEWGLAVNDDVVVDQVRALFNQATSPLAGQYSPDHPVTATLMEPTLFPMVRSVEPTDPGFGHEIIVYSGAESWAERDLDGWQAEGRAEFGDGDLEGPVPLAVAGEISGREGGPGRIIVFGDSDFASNEFVEAYRNKDLFLNAVNWLVGDVEQIAIRPALSRASRFELDAAQFRNIVYLSLFILPEGIAVVGVVAWWWRRGREAAE